MIWSWRYADISKVSLHKVEYKKKDFRMIKMLVQTIKYTNEQLALKSQFTTLLSRFEQSPEALEALNNNLRSKTYVLGNEMDDIDIEVFKGVKPLIKKWTGVEQIANYRHIIRWGDLIQNLTNDDDKFVVPDVELPKEVKEKKKKEDVKVENTKSTKSEVNKGKDEEEVKKVTNKEPSEEEKKARAEAKKAAKAAKAKANAEKAAAEKASQKPPSPAAIDFKVGFIQKAIKHPNADSLYVSTIDCGEEEPRTICSGLVNYIPLQDMQERYVVIVANLKPVAMRGIKSNGMVLCASADSIVEFVNPPPNSKPGDKLFFQDFNGTPEKQLNPKKKIFETVQPLFSTDALLRVSYTEEGAEAKFLVNEAGELCKVSTLVKADVK